MPLGAITVADLVKVCKAQTNRWPDGKPVTFVMRSPSSPEMKMVLEKVYGMSESELNSLIVTSNHARTNHPAILVATSDEELVNRWPPRPEPLASWMCTPSTAVLPSSRSEANSPSNPATCCTATRKCQYPVISDQ